jgi:hypothetical protein
MVLSYLKRLKHTKEGESVYVPRNTVVADEDSNLYVCANMWSFTHKGARFVNKVVRTGTGIGEFAFPEDISPVMCFEQPMYQVPDHLWPMVDSADGALIVPVGYDGNIADYIGDFFPDSLEGYLEERAELESFCEQKKSYSMSKKSLEERYPRSWRLRAKLAKISKDPRGDSRDLAKLARQINEMGEPLSQQELRIYFR